jgi:hypothetical protein
MEKTIEEVYGTASPEIPKYHLSTGEFRVPLSGEIFLNPDDGLAWGLVGYTLKHPYKQPRLILTYDRNSRA